MKKIGKTIFPALIFLFFISGIIFSNEAFSQSANTVASRQDRQTETNTVTVINTDEIRIVTNKQGGHSFQLKHLDILWGTRAALSGMIAAFLLLIAAFSPANSK